MTNVPPDVATESNMKLSSNSYEDVARQNCSSTNTEEPTQLNGDHCDGDCKVNTDDVKEGEDGSCPTMYEMVESFASDIETFNDATDDLQNMFESVNCLLRNMVNGDGRPVGVWKDVC
ncbi:hypothetical protein Q1695_012390 [Nippostrongylus brasiliensis]|nr:hypothetical protein Q1695_012390 [Nippostrongylus brasiliensis]